MRGSCASLWVGRRIIRLTFRSVRLVWNALLLLINFLRRFNISSSLQWKNFQKFRIWGARLLFLEKNYQTMRKSKKIQAKKGKKIQALKENKGSTLSLKRTLKKSLKWRKSQRKDLPNRLKRIKTVPSKKNKEGSKDKIKDLKKWFNSKKSVG